MNIIKHFQQMSWRNIIVLYLLFTATKFILIANGVHFAALIWLLFTGIMIIRIQAHLKDIRSLEAE